MINSKKIISTIGLLFIIALMAITIVKPVEGFAEEELSDSENVEYESQAESWRYQNGQINQEDNDNLLRSKAKASFTPWSKVNGKFINSKGKVINGAIRKGIDISEWQGNIDWAKVKKSDVDFAIIRCGFGSDIKSQDDSKWLRNVEECERLGIPYGVYIYSYANTDAKAKSEAKHVLRLLKGHKPQYPVYYDLEDEVVKAAGKNAIVRRAEIFCSAIEDAGYDAGIYASLDWWNNILNSSSLDKYDKWVAQWYSECQYKKPYRLWQCTADGTVPGIKGRVDLNFDFQETKREKKTVNYSPYRYTDAKAVVNLRKGSGTSYAVLATIPKGTRLLTYGYDKYDGVDGWYKVKYGNKVGYASGDYVKLSYQPYKPERKGKTTVNMYMRSGLSSSYSKIKYMKAGTKVTLHGYYRMYGKDWYRVTYGGVTGYISSKNVVQIDDREKKTVNYSPYRYTDAKAVVNLRKGSGTSYAVLATIPKGTRLLTYGYDKYDGVDGWYKVKYGNKVGYASGDYVKLSYQPYKPERKGKTTVNMYMRSGLSSSYSKIKYMKAGTKVTLHGYYRMYGKDWYRVTYGGVTGYISSKNVVQVK